MPSKISSELSIISLADLERLTAIPPPTTTTSPTPPTAPQLPLKLPEASQSLTLVTKKRKYLDALEQELGGRDQVIDKLSHTNLDKKQQFLLDLLQDPKREHDTLTTIVRDAGLAPNEVRGLLMTSSQAVSHAQAMMRLAESLPQVVQDIVSKAVDAKIECPRCFGSGKEADNTFCLECSGKGLVMRASDLDRQKLILDATGVIKKSPGVQVNQNNVQVNSLNPNSFFSKFVKASDESAYDVSAIDAEVLKDGR